MHIDAHKTVKDWLIMALWATQEVVVSHKAFRTMCWQAFETSRAGLFGEQMVGKSGVGDPIESLEVVLLAIKQAFRVHGDIGIPDATWEPRNDRDAWMGL